PGSSPGSCSSSPPASRCCAGGRFRERRPIEARPYLPTRLPAERLMTACPGGQSAEQHVLGPGCARHGPGPAGVPSSGDAAAGLRLRLLGPVEAWAGDRKIRLGARKGRLVLAVLALEVGRPVELARLVDLAWPGEPPPTATHAIRVCVSGLRSAFR